MGIFREVVKELGSMFFGSPRLAAPLLILIAIAAAVAQFGAVGLAGGALLVGSLAVLAENVFATARKAERTIGAEGSK